MDAHPPQRPPVVAQLDPEVKRKLDEMYKRKTKPKIVKPLKVENVGPIKTMTLGLDWKDLGAGIAGGRPWRHGYRHENPRCTLQVHFRPDNHKSDCTFLQKLTQTTGPVSKSEWDKIIVFGESGNPRLFTIESVEVAKLGGKNVIVMTGQNTELDKSREKTVYVSLSGDWKNSYEFGIGSPADQFNKAESLFDEALKTVVWKEK